MVSVKGIQAYNDVAALQNAAVKIDPSVDYAGHELIAVKLLKEVHTLLLRKDFIGAASTIDQVIVELRLMRGAVRSHIKE